MNKNYELIEHTADLGIRIRGRDLKELFRNAGLAIFKLSSEKISDIDKEGHRMLVRQRAESVDMLFVNWLNELISLSAVEGLIFEDLEISNIDEHNVEATALGRSMQDYKVNTEIKAATYHELKVEKTSQGWLAEVILDV